VNGVEPSTVSHISMQAPEWKEGEVWNIVFAINKTLSIDITLLATSVQ
jgi:hypothetical protein